MQDFWTNKNYFYLKCQFFDVLGLVFGDNMDFIEVTSTKAGGTPDKCCQFSIVKGLCYLQVRDDTSSKSACSVVPGLGSG